MTVILLQVVFCSADLAALAPGDVVLETRDVRATIRPDGVITGLLAKPIKAEYAYTRWPGPGPAFAVVQGKQTWPVTSVVRDGDILAVEFGRAEAAAKLRIKQTDDYIALTLLEVTGRPVDAVHLLQVRLKTLPYLGRWINVAYDNAFGVCLCGGNVRTDASMEVPSTSRKTVEVRATAHREVGLEGATAVLFGCPEPKKTFLDRMAVVERDFGMPRGAANRRSPIQRCSYLWARDPNPGNIDRYIRFAKRCGIRMILFSYRTFTKGAGHFEWNAAYPEGATDLKRVTDAIRGAGLCVGLHIHYSKTDRTDAYVTPVPDDRLHVERRFTLTGPIDAGSEVIEVRENPVGATMDKQRRLLKAGKELIEYERYTTEPPYRFEGCRRGALKTAACEHGVGSGIALLDVDTWPLFIRFDQDTDIQDEVARRIGDIVKQTGPYEMVYFDGSEDVHEPFWYHCANAQYRVYRVLDPEPPVCESYLNTHFSWHMMSRSNAYDAVPPNRLKQFCREYPCADAAQRAIDFTRVDFGWVHDFGKSDKVHLTPDALEYVFGRAAAWDCPVSLSIGLKDVHNPRAESCFEVVKTWEDARIGQRLTDEQRLWLRDLDQEHHLFVNEEGQYELVAIDEVTGMAGGKSIRAYTFRRSGKPDVTYALLWAARGAVDLALEVPADGVTAMRPFGKAIPTRSEAGRTLIDVGERMVLSFSGMGVPQVEEVLRGGRVRRADQ
ncbi:MAG: hypothetical protein JXQ73_17270 [Phycisphaerae bacterium]|nr:hypothetical protein [Phycisphaerae bacterium]